MPIGQELARLRMMGEEKMRDRPEWRGSFPLVNFQATKRLSLGASGMARGRTGAGRVAAAAVRAHRRPRNQAQDTSRGRIRARSRTTAAAPSSSSLVTARTDTAVQAKRGEDRREKNGGQRSDTGTFVSSHASTVGMRGSIIMTKKGAAPLSSSASLLPLSSAALGKAQSKLVTAAMAYDRCVAGAKDCLHRGATTFRAARTYSEQQKAFEESTATLGPAQPARAGYTDWRGSSVVGLQNATIDVVEAMDAWAVEWAAAREDDEHEVEHAVGMSNSNGGSGGSNNSIVIEGEEEVQKVGVAAAVPATAPPFLWEGTPLVSTIIGHSAKLVAGAPELREWYGPGFPIERNPFFLAYPVDDRPVTPRNALVRAWVNGEVCGGVSVVSTLNHATTMLDVGFTAVQIIGYHRAVDTVRCPSGKSLRVYTAHSARCSWEWPIQLRFTTKSKIHKAVQVHRNGLMRNTQASHHTHLRRRLLIDNNLLVYAVRSFLT